MAEINYIYLTLAIAGGLLLENFVATGLRLVYYVYKAKKLKPLMEAATRKREVEVERWIAALTSTREDDDFGTGGGGQSTLPN